MLTLRLSKRRIGGQEVVQFEPLKSSVFSAEPKLLSVLFWVIKAADISAVFAFRWVDESSIQKSEKREAVVVKMHIKSVMVDDQAKALAFYTDVLGFQVKDNIPMGEHSWITLISPEEAGEVELALEPNAYSAAQQKQPHYS